MKASRFLIAGAVAALLPFAAAVAQTPPPEPTEQPATTPPPAEPSQPAESGKGVTFESLDTDSDGRISKTEAAVNPNVSDQFTRYDKNANGYIERDEVTSASSAPSGEPKQ